MSVSQYDEWSIEVVETGDVLGVVGGEEATRERLRALNEDGEGRYRLVSRVVILGSWEPVE